MRIVLLIVSFCLTFWANFLNAQCTNSISNFPYTENFESNNGNWLSGGSNSDWAYGTPSKSIINTAASGTKCWITGGLTGNFYNNGENSWLESPCFDFTTLVNPMISFSVFWETERRYDGASFQYSTDAGSSWQVLGSINSNTNCDGQNWFNFSPVNTLGIAGWSGTISPNSGSCLGTGGSNGWVTAKHILTALAGKTNVKFRFVFAAGTTCNNFNGFAIDDVLITEAAANTANFTYACGANKTVQFTNTSSLCGSNFSWNFGDALSSLNTSTDENPSHTFSAAGKYTVTLVVTFPGNIIVSKQIEVTVLEVTTSLVQAISCWGNGNGIIKATATGSTATYNYSWNTNPIQNTATASNLIAGTYIVTVSATNACTTTASIILREPDRLTGTISTTNAICKQNNGTANAIIAGGVIPYSYSWSNGFTTSTISNLKSDTYYLTVNDANSCLLSLNGFVKDSTNNILLNLGKDTSFCPGYTLLLNAGNYSSYLWQDNSINASFLVTKTGDYYVTVKDADGCTKTDSIKVVVDCNDIYFPSAFTPNKDGLNDSFGPLGNLLSLTNFVMNIYNRWGQLVYTTSNPFAKWNGKQNGKDAEEGNYIFTSTYSINNQPNKTVKGLVVIIR